MRNDRRFLSQVRMYLQLEKQSQRSFSEPLAVIVKAQHSAMVKDGSTVVDATTWCQTVIDNQFPIFAHDVAEMLAS